MNQFSKFFIVGVCVNNAKVITTAKSAYAQVLMAIHDDTDNTNYIKVLFVDKSDFERVLHLARSGNVVAIQGNIATLNRINRKYPGQMDVRTVFIGKEIERLEETQAVNISSEANFINVLTEEIYKDV